MFIVHIGKKYLRLFWLVCIYGCCALGAAVIIIFVGQQLKLFTVPGSVDPRTSLFSLTPGQFASYHKQIGASAENETLPHESTPTQLLCKIVQLSSVYPIAGSRVYAAFLQSKDYDTVEKMLYATTTSIPELQSMYEKCLDASARDITNSFSADVYPWLHSAEWQVLRVAFTRDQASILKVATETGVSPRLIMGPVIGEQLRFFTSARATFKSYMQPLKVFIHLSKMSYGVAGMKPDTALRIEQNLRDPKSVFYPGKAYEHMLDYDDGVDTDSERMRRITDEHDHYYAYLYVALSLRQFEAQWRNAGFPIDGRPEVLATLYNLGQNRSIPKSNPAAGGAVINLDNKQYTFGGLAYDFYWSGELLELFPFSTN